jgi:putative FmdB family regulatory protein
MPFYEYTCKAGCPHVTAAIRRVKNRNRAPRCEKCGGRTEITWSTPSVNVWSSDWKFNHMSAFGDGTKTFPNEKAYRDHLKELGADETALGVREV